MADPRQLRQFQDSGGGNYSGMIDIDGHRNPVFIACAMYQWMPMDRVTLTSDDGAIEGLASFRGHPRPHDRKAVLSWNRSDQPRHVRVSFPGYVGAGLDVTNLYQVCRIDQADDHPATGMVVHPQWHIDPEIRSLSQGWEGDLASHGVLFLNDDLPRSGSDFGDYVPPVCRIVRELHDYPDRSSRCYADFDRRTWTARLGMAGEDHVTARVGATVDGLAEADLTATVTGTVRPSGAVAARVDYQSRGGAYTRAVLFRLTDGGTADAPVWGTARPAEQFVKQEAGVTEPLDVKGNAPPDWTGRVQVSFVLADAGPDLRATFRLTGR